MNISWNEIKHRAIAFSKEWQNETREHAEAKPFWEAFFQVFGQQRRHVASYEEPVKKLSGEWGYIDLLWPKMLLAEHKSAGKDLGKAHAQGMEYVRGLINSGRQAEAPRYLIVSDFRRIAIHDLEPEEDPDLPLLQRLPPSVEFPVADLHQHIGHFAFIAGYKQHRLNPEDPANEEATLLMCDLYDALEESAYGTDDTGRAGHELKQFLVRILFCLFAEDNGIFPVSHFKFFIEDFTAEDGSDLGPKVGMLFDVLNTPETRRQKGLEEHLRQFPYVNGNLFAERLALPALNSTLRRKLLACCAFDWSRISPAVFGSLFQAVMEPKERRQVGAHYTAEHNILKLVRSLFLDDLRAEFDAAKRDRSGRGPGRLDELQRKLSRLRFLDPACGCGNFLVITYREIRKLELDILAARHGDQQVMTLDQVDGLSLLDVDQMYGIEIEEFPVRIAEVALWLADHQANMELSKVFTQYYCRIPLRKSPHIHVANALRADWKSILPPAECSYILGNPPFVGKSLMADWQKEDMGLVWGKAGGGGLLDYVTAWYLTAARYVQRTAVKVGFVSTNSVTQGEQVGVLWGEMFAKWRIKIHFAHRTFQWESEARGKAHVHCVIIGFAAFDTPEKRLHDYHADAENPVVTAVSNISPYLVEASDLALPSRTTPLCEVPPVIYGNKPADAGHLIIEPEDYQSFLAENPTAAPYVRPMVSAEEYLHGRQRYCLWLADAPPGMILQNPGVKLRVQGVRDFRLASRKGPTRDAALRPTLFAEIRQPSRTYILIPRHSSETRRYVPFGWFDAGTIVHDSCTAIPDAEIYHFGVLSSLMHMAWMRQTCGRLESRFRYSNKIVYNNYPWPAPTDTQRAAVERAAQRVLDARAAFPTSTLADLYNPLAMPPALFTAHTALDRAVDRCYRREDFPTDRARVEHLFALYEQLTVPLAAAAAKPKPRRAPKADTKILAESHEPERL